MWVSTTIGFLVGILFAPTVIKLSQYIGLSLFNRDGLDSLTLEYLGENNDWSTILQDDLLLTTFDYNGMRPRFYSDYFIRKFPGFYNLKIHQAAAASASAPLAFSPLIAKNKFNINEALIDGGIICNNPALYAYQIAYYLREKRNIRMISIGTGVPTENIKSYGNTEPVKNIA